MIRRFTHTSIAMSDPDEMLGFYRNLLGMEVMNDFDTATAEPQRQQFFKTIHAMPQAHIRFVSLKCSQPPLPEFALELKKWYAPTPEALPDWQRQNDLGLHIIAFFVDDLNPVYEKVLKAGVTCISTPQRTTTVGCFKCYDPEGNVIEFIERPANVPPRPAPPPQSQRQGPPLVDRLTHTSIAVKDTEKMLGFYRDLLGLQLTTDHDTLAHEPARQQFYKKIHGMPETHFRMTRLKAPEAPLATMALELKKWYFPSARPLPNWQRQCDIGLHIVAFRVSNLGLVYEKVGNAGVKTISPPQWVPGGVGCFKCYDPEGNVVEFLQPAAV